MTLGELEQVCRQLKSDGCTDLTEVRFQTFILPKEKPVFRVSDVQVVYRVVNQITASEDQSIIVIQ